MDLPWGRETDMIKGSIKWCWEWGYEWGLGYCGRVSGIYSPSSVLIDDTEEDIETTSQGDE